MPGVRLRLMRGGAPENCVTGQSPATSQEAGRELDSPASPDPSHRGRGIFCLRQQYCPLGRETAGSSGAEKNALLYQLNGKPVSYQFAIDLKHNFFWHKVFQKNRIFQKNPVFLNTRKPHFCLPAGIFSMGNRYQTWYQAKPKGMTINDQSHRQAGWMMT